jgi:hypothetical protein
MYEHKLFTKKDNLRYTSSVTTLLHTNGSPIEYAVEILEQSCPTTIFVPVLMLVQLAES